MCNLLDGLVALGCIMLFIHVKVVDGHYYYYVKVMGQQMAYRSL